MYCAESPDFDINVRDNAGYTPLHEACNRGHLDIAQVNDRQEKIKTVYTDMGMTFSQIHRDMNVINSKCKTVEINILISNKIINYLYNLSIRFCAPMVPMSMLRVTKECGRCMKLLKMAMQNWLAYCLPMVLTQCSQPMQGRPVLICVLISSARSSWKVSLQISRVMMAKCGTLLVLHGLVVSIGYFKWPCTVTV